jgi:hypothetical protein
VPPVCLADLPQVFQAGLVALAVGLQARRVGDVELFGQVLHQFGRDVEWIVEELADVADGRELDCVPEFVVVTAFGLDQAAVDVIEEEVPLQLGAGEPAGETTVGGCLVIGQELDRHCASPAAVSVHCGGIGRTSAAVDHAGQHTNYLVKP